jgi:hypothetical protein
MVRPPNPEWSKGGKLWTPACARKNGLACPHSVVRLVVSRTVEAEGRFEGEGPLRNSQMSRACYESYERSQ